MNIKSRLNSRNNLLRDILIKRGVMDVDKLINPTSENDTTIEDMQQIHDALTMYKRNLSKTILILVDSDADGYSSAAIMYKYTKMVNPLAKVKFFVHSVKTHGLTNEFMAYALQTRPDMIIVPDAGTNDIAQREKLQAEGIDLLIIDHHEEDKHTDCGGILINNHANFPKNNINKNLTGAGMAYTVCKMFDQLDFNTNRYKELRDLAMVGLIGDCASLIENETRNICLNGLKNIHSNMIKTVIETNNQNIDSVTFKNMQWGGIVPLINAVVRIGTREERELMFKALADIETDYFKVVEKRKLNKETRKYEMVPFNLNSYQLAIEAAAECKKRQEKIIKAELKSADSQFNPKAGIQIFKITTDEGKSLTGLIASKLTSLWQQPVLVIWELNGEYIGSLRGYEKSIKSLKNWCMNTGLFTLAQGHDNAAGIQFPVENLDKIIKETENVEYEGFVYEVDYLYESFDIIKEDIFNISNNSFIFDNGLQQPIFGVKEIPVNADTAAWSKNTLRIKIDGVTFIKFKVSEDEYLELIKNNGSTIDVVGTFSVNEWKGMKFPQMMIDEFEINENTERIQMYGIFA